MRLCRLVAGVQARAQPTGRPRKLCGIAAAYPTGVPMYGVGARIAGAAALGSPA
jgi:hypothetical protein